MRGCSAGPETQAIRLKPRSSRKSATMRPPSTGIVGKERGDRVGRRVDRHDGHALDLAEAAEEFRGGVGGHHHDPVDTLGKQRAHIGHEALRDVVGVADHQDVARLEAGSFDAPDYLAEKRVRRRGDDHADGAGAARFQRAREFRRQVAELVDGFVHPGSCIAAHRPRLVDDMRDRRERDIGAPGDVLDRDHRCGAPVSRHLLTRDFSQRSKATARMRIRPMTMLCV